MHNHQHGEDCGCPDCESMKERPCSIQHVPREILEHKLLMALEDGNTVAAMLTKSDVELLIDALEGVAPDGMNIAERRANFAADLKQLLREAFR